jgi:hypothetical protein
MATPTFDDREWPLVRIRQSHALSDHDFGALLDYIDALFLRGQRFAVLLDVREAPPLTAPQRKAVAERANKSCARYPTRLVGMALVMSSALQRGVFTAIQWLCKDSHPTRAFGDITSAEAWLRACLDA